MSRIMLLFFPVLVVFATIPLTGCGSTVSTAGYSQTETTGSGIRIIVPGEHEPSQSGLSGEFLCPVKVEVSNFKLVDKFGEANVAGEGHIHYFLDTMPIASPEKTGGDNYAESSETVYYWNDIGDEVEHVFSAELVNNDHTPLSPRVLDIVTVSTDTSWDG